MCADPKYEEEVSGCTASVGLITNTQIFVVSCKRDCFSNTANIHRRTLVILDLYLVSKAERNHCLSITSLKMKVRHNRERAVQCIADFREGEKARICAAGGFVDFGRVNGNLALSRAIGDFEFKKSAELSPEQQIVTAFPDVVAHTITDDDEFLVIACDGT